MGYVGVVPLSLWAWVHPDHLIPPASACRSTQYGQHPHRMCPHPAILHVHSQMLRVPRVPLTGPRMCDHLATLSQQSLSHIHPRCLVSRHHVCPCLHTPAAPRTIALYPC
jgi:hypothetical protein